MKCKYEKHELEEIVKKSCSIAEVCRQLGLRPIGGNYKTIKIKLSSWQIDSSHFSGRGWRKGNRKPIRQKFPINQILVEHCGYSSHRLKERLIEEGFKTHRCEQCANESWNNQKIPLELEHCNGINTDNRLENLKLLCPNCHAQTKHYRGRAKKTSALSEMKDVEYRKFREALPKEVGNPEPSLTENRLEGAESRHGKPKLVCLNCGKELGYKGNKYCNSFCYREHTGKKIPKVPEILGAFQKFKSFVQVGKFFNVSDNAVRKWCDKYGISDMVKV